MNRVHRALATFIAVHVAVYLYGDRGVVIANGNSYQLQLAIR